MCGVCVSVGLLFVCGLLWVWCVCVGCVYGLCVYVVCVGVVCVCECACVVWCGVCVVWLLCLCF